MKFLEKIFGRKKEEPETLYLELEKLPEWIKNESEKEIDELRPSIQDIYKEINDVLEELKHDKEYLMEAEPVETADKRMEKVGDSNRDNIIDNLDMLMEKISIPDDFSLQGSYKFYVDSRSDMNTFLDNARKSMIYAKALYPEEYRKIDTDLERLNELLSDLFKTIKEPKNKLDSSEDIIANIENIHNLWNEIDTSRNNIQKLKDKYSSLNKGMEETESQLDRLKSSQEYAKAKEIENEIQNTRIQINDMESEIKRMFTPLSKALSRMKKQDENKMYKLSPQLRKMLDMIMDNPSSAIDYDLSPVYDEVLLRIENDSLGLKDKKKEKTLEQVQKLKNSSEPQRLYEIKNQHNIHLNQLMEKLDQISVYNKKESLEKEIFRKKSMLESIQKELDTEKKHLDNLEVKLEDEKSELNSNMRTVFGQDIIINY
ncbi:hypothetical protein Mzhil_0852 [Methanosalsum zhilinae DSM 4017]|uniref:Uncharacterized protein n=1 Tax=Methanosalsum zhilinae (strain DSM 4017 / NBRC 107636 / OCM 62 / WeN5) TaxID=679901 RepID=F7XLI2_METZD|nr:hypothetical protein [Methanosalsum zhilinae]AEH60714.1 hypothetical protein Mzhil_0852 [Methanosalsum zhilinae DSM 4017]